MLKKTYPKIELDETNNDEIKILEYTDGQRVKTIKFGNVEIAGVEARTLFELKSTNFEVIDEGDKITFNVIGFGHGVGMSQTGADALALSGKKYEEIIHHYYSNIEILTLDDIE